jgi:hypothetical protein
MTAGRIFTFPGRKRSHLKPLLPIIGSGSGGPLRADSVKTILRGLEQH